MATCFRCHDTRGARPANVTRVTAARDATLLRRATSPTMATGCASTARAPRRRAICVSRATASSSAPSVTARPWRCCPPRHTSGSVRDERPSRRLHGAPRARARAEPGACADVSHAGSLRACHVTKLGSPASGRRSPHPPGWVGLAATDNAHGREAAAIRLVRGLPRRRRPVAVHRLSQVGGVGGIHIHRDGRADSARRDAVPVVPSDRLAAVIRAAIARRDHRDRLCRRRRDRGAQSKSRWPICYVRASAGHVAHVGKIACAACHGRSGFAPPPPRSARAAMPRRDAAAPGSHAPDCQAATASAPTGDHAHELHALPRGRRAVSTPSARTRPPCGDCHRAHRTPSLDPKPCTSATPSSRPSTPARRLPRLPPMHECRGRAAATAARCHTNPAGRTRSASTDARSRRSSQCTGCHVPHDSARRRSSRARRVIARARARAGAHARCTDCHSPHDDAPSACTSCHHEDVKHSRR